MTIIGNILIALIALLHLYILVLEMFLWDKPAGLKAFGLPKEFAESTKTMAANQGLYNGFLAAGLILSLMRPSALWQFFFLTCIFIAGIIGGLTSSKKIILIQSVPSFAALIILLLNQ